MSPPPAFPRERAGKPLPRSLEVLPALVEEANHEVNDKGERSLEWAVVGCDCSNNDDQVEEATGSGETC